MINGLTVKFNINLVGIKKTVLIKPDCLKNDSKIKHKRKNMKFPIHKKD